MNNLRIIFAFLFLINIGNANAFSEVLLGDKCPTPDSLDSTNANSEEIYCKKILMPDSLVNKNFGELLTKLGDKDKFKYWVCMNVFGLTPININDNTICFPEIAHCGDSIKYSKLARKYNYNSLFRDCSVHEPQGYYIVAINKSDKVEFIDTDKKFIDFISANNNPAQIIAILASLHRVNFITCPNSATSYYYETAKEYFFLGESGDYPVKCSMNKDFKTFNEQLLDQDY